jgi:hypothetical protein
VLTDLVGAGEGGKLIQSCEYAKMHIIGVACRCSPTLLSRLETLLQIIFKNSF